MVMIGKLPLCRKILGMVLKSRKNLRKKKQGGNVMCVSGEVLGSCMHGYGHEIHRYSTYQVNDSASSAV